MTTKELSPHQRSVIVEREELETKLQKLQAYLDRDEWKNLERSEKVRLNRQFKIMVEYRAILDERIHSF